MWLFVGLWLFVIFVSVFDGYLALRDRTELRPHTDRGHHCATGTRRHDRFQALIGGVLIGLAATLLLLGNGRIAGISGILAGTIAAASAVLLLYGRRPRVGLVVAGFVASAQLCLLLYLLLA